MTRQRLRHRAAALREAFLDAVKQRLERAGHFAEPRLGALVDLPQVGIVQGRRLLIAPAERFVDRPAAADQRLLDRAELGGKIAGERVRSVADLAQEVAPASVDCALESRQTVAERGLDAAGLGDERLIDRVVMRGGRGLELPETLGGFCRQLLEMIAEAAVEILAASPQDRVQRAEMVGQPCAEVVRVNGDAIDHAVAVVADQIVERLQMPAHPACLIGQGVDETRAALAHDALERRNLR